MNDPSVTDEIPSDLAGYRLDQALAQMFPEFSRSRLKQWILDGSVVVDGRVWRPRDTVSGGESVLLEPVVEEAIESRPEAIDLDIAHEDSSVIVVNKPAGLVVHPGAGNPNGTLVNGLMHRFPELSALPRAGLVHRLDKDTSGLLLIARSLQAHTSLVRQLEARQIHRQYDAVCRGVLTGGGTIDAPIRRHPVDRVRMTVQDGGRRAVTHYRVVERFRAHTYIRVSLETGRTHQIRVHFAWRHHALVGDPVYGGRFALPPSSGESLTAALRGFRRQALCATALEFEHPERHESVTVEAPPADDFTALLGALRGDAEAHASA